VDVEIPALAIILILFQVGDAIACIGPIDVIRKGLDAVNCPPRIRQLLPFVKFDGAIGLTIGLWEPIIGALTIVALVIYFIVAIGFHVRARDAMANTVPAVVVATFVIVVGALSYFPAV
jgi:hypothetical protein